MKINTAVSDFIFVPGHAGINGDERAVSLSSRAGLVDGGA